MNRRDSDFDRALRAAAGIGDADVPRLPSAAIADLAAETVETISWTFADGPESTAAGTAGPRHPFAAATRGRRRLALAAALAVAAAGGTAAAVSVASMRSNTPAVLLDWQAIPRLAPDADARQAVEACIQYLEPGGGKYSTLDFKVTDALLSEQRGRTLFTVLANDNSFGSCMMLDGRGDGAGSWQTAHGYAHPSATGISLAANGSSWTMDIHDKRVDTTDVAGFAGSAVTGITVRRADGVVITASMNDGLWAAWWPGTSTAVSVTVHTRGGHSETTPIGKVMTVPPIATAP